MHLLYFLYVTDRTHPMHRENVAIYSLILEVTF